MGSYQSIYVGPYMVFTNKIIVKTVLYYVCNNNNCKEYNKKSENKFCPSCGDILITKPFGEDKIVNTDRVLREEFDHNYYDDLYVVNNIDNSSFDNKSVIISNKHTPSNIKIEEGTTINEIDPTKMMDDIVWFKDKFRKYIDVFKSQFGNDAFVVKWGIVVYYS